MKFLRALFSTWTWQMAWRDSRASRRKLLLFSSSIVIGIAALVALSSFGANLKATIEEQAKALLGADLVLGSRDPFTPEMEALFEQIGGVQAREILFSSMAYFPKIDGTRLVQIRALEEGFPFYGGFEAAPADAGKTFIAEKGALAEEALLLQFDSEPGDTVKLGEKTFPIIGALRKVPGENMVFATLAPRIYIPMSELESTQLLNEENFARYKIYFKFPGTVDVEKLVLRYKPRLEKLQLSEDTVEERKRNLGRSLENLNHFLNVGGFIALLLGAIGVASAIHVHVQQKTASIAVLRCLGATVSGSFAVYLVQAIVLGLAGALVGGVIGLAIQSTLPRVLSDFLPFKLSLEIYWGPVLRAMSIGFGVCIVFALLPLIRLRRISPLAVLRNAYEGGRTGIDRASVLLVMAIIGGLIYFARMQTGKWSHALGFAGGLVASFVLLALMARVLRGLAGKMVGKSRSYLWRQGFANLYRPQNRTLLLLVSLGLGTFLVLTIYLTNRALSADLFPKDRASQPNAALFDIQPDQREGVVSILKEQSIPLIDEVPIVTMRLSTLKGESVQRMLRQRGLDMPRWALRREYRSTFRDKLAAGEELVAGAWPATNSTPEIPAVSIEEEIAGDLKLSLGDEIVVDVQGILLTNRIGSIRKVDWKRIQPNFFMVFEPEVLEAAPATYILTARVDSRERSAQMQRTVVKAFPNVSIIDLALVLDTINAILEKIGFVIRFMALFTIATGVIVLVGSILTGRYQRIQESILLRTLGASKKQVQRILLIEYFLLGLLSAATGVLLSVLSSWALSTFLFKVGFTLYPIPLLVAMAAVTGLTVLTGLIANRGVLDSPPLEVLRQG